MSKKADKTLTLIDLFSGCGGMSLGLEQAGFLPVLTCELNNDARATYMANRPEVPEYFKEVADISTITKNKGKELKGFLKEWEDNGIAKVDLVAGGPLIGGFLALAIGETMPWTGTRYRRTSSSSRWSKSSRRYAKDVPF